MKIHLVSLILVIVFSGTLHANAYEDVNEFYDQCMPLIEIVERSEEHTSDGSLDVCSSDL